MSYGTINYASRRKNPDPRSPPTCVCASRLFAGNGLSGTYARTGGGARCELSLAMTAAAAAAAALRGSWTIWSLQAVRNVCSDHRRCLGISEDFLRCTGHELHLLLDCVATMYVNTRALRKLEELITRCLRDGFTHLLATESDDFYFVQTPDSSYTWMSHYNIFEVAARHSFLPPLRE